MTLLAPSDPQTHKGPLTSVAQDGAWSEGLQKARVYERVLLEILLGDLKPLQALDEKDLARRHAAGLSGVREALGRLALEGLVVRRPRVGTIVAPLDVKEIEHAFAVRRMLEGPNAALAAQNASDAAILAICGAFEGAESAVAEGDFRALLAMDRAFHRHVAMAGGNPTLGRYVLALQNVATRFWICDMRQESDADQLRDIALHRQLAAAIRARDPQGAERAANALIGDPPSAYPR